MNETKEREERKKKGNRKLFPISFWRFCAFSQEILVNGKMRELKKKARKRERKKRRQLFETFFFCIRKKNNQIVFAKKKQQKMNILFQNNEIKRRPARKTRTIVNNNNYKDNCNVQIFERERYFASKKKGSVHL